MMRWHSYVGIPVLTYDASAICQDPDLILPKQIQKIRWCLSVTIYTGDWLFSKSRHLAILSNSIKPWPMTRVDERCVMCGCEYRVLDNQVWRAFDPSVTNGKWYWCGGV